MTGHTASLPRLLLATLAAGVLVAGLAVPAVAGAGLVVRQGVVSFENLPAALQTPPLPQRSNIVAADGTYLTSLYSENRVSVTAEQIPLVMRKAIVAIEDSRFYEHHGVDMRGIIRAMVRNQQAGHDVQGASTLTQQYVKNVLVQSADNKQQQEAAVAQSNARKLQEVRYAIALEKHLSKNEILTRYLNIALFGPGVYGVGTAASTYFGKSVSQLTLPEAATLAGLVQNPAAFDPVRHPAAAQQRRDTVLARMAQTGAVTQDEADAAMKTPLTLHRKPTPNGCIGAALSGQFCAYVLRYLLSDPALGATTDARQARLYNGGLTIQTTLDPTLQLDAQRALNHTFSTKSRYVGVMGVVQPGTGYVKAVASNRPFSQDQNLYVTSDTFQTGSTAKAFMLVAALQKGLPLSTKIFSPHDYTSKVLKNTLPSGQIVNYAVSNDARGMHGLYDMRTAFAASVNTYFVQLEERVGVDKGVAAAEAMGVTRTKQLDSYAAHPLGYGAFTLGAASISPLDMANAYATIAAKGVECRPVPVLSVTDSGGREIDAGAKSCHQAIDPAVAAAAADAMSWTVKPKGPVIDGNTGGRAAVPGHDIGGKTGTTQDIKEAWFVGFSTQYAAASLVLDPKHEKTLPGGDRSNQIATQAFHDFMLPALAKQPNVPFPKVDPTYLSAPSPTTPPGTGAQDYVVPQVADLPRSAATAAVEAAGLSWQVSRVPSGLPADTVVDTSPAAGTQLVRGDVVTIEVSDGSGDSQPNPVPAPVPSFSPLPSPSPSQAAPAPPQSPQPRPSRSKKCKFPFRCHR